LSTVRSIADPFALNPHVVTQRSDDGLVVLDPATVRFVELDDIGADLWEALVATADPAEALDRLVAAYDVEPAELEADLVAFMQHLIDCGLAHRPDGDAAGDGGAEPAVAVTEPVDLYLDLLARSLTGMTALGSRDLRNHAELTLKGWNIQPGPEVATLVGLPRLRNIRALVERVVADGVPGDVMECGVWRGGAAIMMRGVLAALGVTDRRVWLADSFAGLPEPDLARDPLDVAWQGSEGLLAVPEDEVRRTFQLYGLLDDAVRFLPGWFADTLPTAPVEHLAVLRLDGDLYRSTLDALTHLYPKVSPGGFVIIDDYAMASCRAAVEEYRAAHGIDAELVHIDLSAVWWRVPLG